MSVAVGMTPDWKQWEGDLVDGEFALGELLGSGKKSAVFRTRSVSENGAAPKRAIKLVQARAEDVKPLVEQWTRSSGLDHPHLLKILKAGDWTKGGASFAYLVMEHADENLGTVLEERKLTADEVFEMLRPIANTLVFLHGRRLTLGNLKPGNIFAVDETLKVASDAIAAGDPAGDLKAFAAAVSEALTQKPELNGIESLPEPFREMVRNCVGASGQPAWSSVDLVNWLRSPQSSARPAAGAVAKPKPKPGITRYALATGVVFAAVIVVGSVIKSRESAPPAAGAATQPAQPAGTPAPVATNPATSNPAAAAAPANPVASKDSRATAKSQKANPPESAPAPVKESPPARAEASSASPSASTGQAVEQPMPDISAKARATIHGTVVINVKTAIDETGVVTDAVLQPTNSRYLGKLCAQAVRKWRFTPAAGGASHIVRFVITKDDTQVSVR